MLKETHVGAVLCYSGHNDEVHSLSATNICSCLTGSKYIISKREQHIGNTYIIQELIFKLKDIWCIVS